MHLFYTPGIEHHAESFTLNEEESRHCIKVLRLAEGEQIFLVDGCGGFFISRISSADPRATRLEITSLQPDFNRRNHYLHIAIAPTKNIERLEWFLEKSTEIGIDEITPVICNRSERKDIRTDRLQKVLISAMKQSVKAYLPRLNEPVKLDSFISEAFKGQKFIAHCMDSERFTLREKINLGGNYRILIGPEGDFTPDEAAKCSNKGYIPVSLGSSRLRTETAALEACFEINYLNRS